MCKRKIQEVCTTLTFLLGSGFGFGISYFHEKTHGLHVILLILLAGIGFHLTQLKKDFVIDKKS